MTLTLQNPTGDRVAFKVKTTSPKKYCVRPSNGFVEPNSSKDVQVILQAQREMPASLAGEQGHPGVCASLQPMHPVPLLSTCRPNAYPSPPGADCKDKFLIQCVKLPGSLPEQNEIKEITSDLFDTSRVKDIRYAGWGRGLRRSAPCASTPPVCQRVCAHRVGGWAW